MRKQKSRHFTGITGIILAAGLLTITFSGCLTRAPVVDSPEIVITAADLTITLKPLGYDTLKELHGSNRRQWLNPYIDFPGQIPQRRIVVFEARLETEVSSVNIFIRDIKLGIGGQVGKAASVEYLNNLWLGTIRNTAWEATIPAVTRRTMLPREFVVKPGESAEGYLVFAERYPKEGGAALLEIPVSTDDGDRGVLEYEMFFTEEGIDTEVVEANTGIFAGDETQSEN